MIVAFELAGTTPLIMHHDNIEASDRLNEWRKDPHNKKSSRAGDDRSPPWTWTTYLYSDGQHITIPGENLMAALRTAGAQLTLKRMKTFKELTQSALLLTTDFLTFRCKGKQITTKEIADIAKHPFPIQWDSAAQLNIELFMKRAKIGQAKHVRVRPKFPKWSATGAIEIQDDNITPEILTQLFNLAGKAGLGDWRPSSKTPGRYGMFTAKLAA